MTLIELLTFRRKGHAEHDNQSYVSEGGDRGLGGQGPDRPLHRSGSPNRAGRRPSELAAIDARISEEIDAAVDAVRERAASRARSPRSTACSTDPARGRAGVVSEARWLR